VLLGRALAAEPAVLLLDEPLSNLDPYWVLRTVELLRDAVADQGAAIVALHDLSLLGRFDRAILMDKGEMVLDGPPEPLLQSPLFERVFRIRTVEGSWRLSPEEGPRSSR
jgi:iron complex transport system ATP-binding protein